MGEITQQIYCALVRDEPICQGLRSTYRDLGHAGILAAVGLGGAVDRAIALSGSVLVGEVINHLRVELLGGLGLATTSIAALARGLGSTATATGAAGGLGSSRRLGLGLLCDALAERLGGGNLRGEGGVVNNLDLFGRLDQVQMVKGTPD